MFATKKTRVGTAAAVAALGLAAAGFAGPASATTTATAERLAGIDRYGTARALAQETFDTADTAFIASGERFPDALAATGIAGSRIGPILLVERDRIPAATTATLTDLGVENIVILGGTAAVSQSVEDELASGYAVSRIAGEDRYATAAAIAAVMDAEMSVGAFDGQRAAFLARGGDFPDALATGPLAYFGSVPILLTQTNTLTPVTAAALDQQDIEVVIIAGGTDAVSASVAEAVASRGIDVIRLAGTTRIETAVEMAEFGVQQFGLLAEHANIARADKFPDALAGGSHAGDLEMSPILLSAGDELSAPTADWIESHCDTIESLHILGGTNALSEAVLLQAVEAARSC